MTLRAATWNIRKCIGTDRRRDPARVLACLAHIDADVVTLQEADRRFGARAAAIPHAMLATDGRWEAVDFGIREAGIGWHGNAILVRRGMRWRHARALDLPMLEPRGAVLAEIEIGGRWLRVMGAHLDLSGMWRRRQVRALIGHLDDATRAHGPLPTVLMGDFNQWRDSGALSEFAFHHLRLLHTPRSFHSSRPVARLDRVAISHDLTELGNGSCAQPEFVRASDHLPIWVELAFRGVPIL